MPQKKKKSTARKRTSSTGKSRAAVKKTKEQTIREYEIKRDITIVLIIAVSIFLFVCNFNVAGRVGNYLSNFQFGLFGLAAYLMPLFIGGAVLFVMANPGDRFAYIKLAATGVIVFMLQTLIDIFAGVSKISEKYNFKAFYDWCVDNHKGGGIFASSLAYGLLAAISRVGSVLIIVFIIIVCLIILFEHKFIDSIKNTHESISERNRQGREIKAELAEERAIQNEEKRKKREEALEQRRRDSEERKALQEQREAERRERAREHEEKKQLDRQQKEEKEILKPKPRNNHPDITTNTQIGPSVIAPAVDSETGNIHEINIDNFDPEGIEKAVTVKTNTNPVDEIIVITPPETVDEPVITPVTKTVHEIVSEPVSNTTVSTTNDNPVPQKPVAKKPADPSNNGVMGLNAEHKGYVFPPIELLTAGNKNTKGDARDSVNKTAEKLIDTLAQFGVKATFLTASQGPTVTRFELMPASGTKVSRIKNLSDDIKLALAATDIRIEAPIPGKTAIGIEVPNKEPIPVIFRDMIESDEFRKCDSKLAFTVGKDISGRTIIYDIDKFPHILIAGTTGSGKSVCINTLIMSIIYKAHPDDVKFIMIDPKVVELSVYNGIPHLICPVVTDMKKAAAALNQAVAEMMDRYDKFAKRGVRDISGYNKAVTENPENEFDKKMPYIVIIVDEFADLIISSRNEVEDAICRLAALARACGIHLVLATQRPSADVITGLIKSNMPSRIAFAVGSQIESRIILDMGGAEELIGKGDMLFFPKGLKKPVRLQGGYIKDDDVITVADFLRKNNQGGSYDDSFQQKLDSAQNSSGGKNNSSDGGSGLSEDDMFVAVGRYVVETQKASIGNIQRKFKMGFNRAARIMDELAELGIVTEEEGTKPRTVLMTSVADFDSFVESKGL